METSEEKKSAESKSKSQWFEVAVILLIAAVILISGVWLWKMSDVLKSPPGHVEVRHVYANFSADNKKSVEKEETQYTLYKQAEETLREQMNTWLTIVGFFGVLFGLIVPLASYLLQRRSLSEERERIMEGVKEAAAAAAEKAAEKASKEAADAKTEAKKAAEGAAKDAVEAKKAAENATKDASDAKHAASDAETEAKKALDNVETAKGEMQKRLDDALIKIEEASRRAQDAVQRAQEAKDVADKAQEMAKEAGKTMQPVSGSRPIGGTSKDSLKAEFEAIRQKAGQGDARAQTRLGYRYEHGLGVEKDEFEAVYWYRKAANQNYAMAQYNLGVMYDFGQGVDKNYENAFYWYRKAAEQRHPGAENNLACLLESGEGCEKNEQAALDWYRKAAEHGDAMGLKNLGEIYEKGKFGVEMSLTTAKKLYRRVVDDPNSDEKIKQLAQEGLDRIAKLEDRK